MGEPLFRPVVERSRARALVGCAEVMHLVAAARVALSGFMPEIVEDHLLLHVSDPATPRGSMACGEDGGPRYHQQGAGPGGARARDPWGVSS